MRDWNVVVTAREGRYRQAREFLESMCGETARTGYYNVLVGRTEDPEGLLERLSADPNARDVLGRAVPLASTFEFQRADELDEAAIAAATELAPALSGKSFHVRFHRRGFKGRVRSVDEEHRLNEAIVRVTSERGDPARVTFDSPDAIVVVETVDNRGGMSVWTREQLQRWPLLHLD